jgi:transcriptional regulator with XRE-family HTH domain
MTEQQKREMGERVSHLRDAAGMTNESLARASGLSTKTVSRIVNGRHEARVATIEALATALQVPEREIRGAPPSPFGEDAALPIWALRVEAKLDQGADREGRFEALIERQNGLLARQTAILERMSAILERIEASLAREEEASAEAEEAKRDADESARDLRDAVAQTIQVLRDASPAPTRAARARATKRTPQA